MSQLSKRSIEELLEYAWLNLDDLDKVKIENPFKHRTRFELDNPHIHLLKIIRQPKYFPFTCKHILNLTIAPFQTVILQELWYRKYMMLVASRGAGKTWILALYAILRALLCQGSKVTFVGGSFRQAKTLFDNAENFWANAPVLRSMFDINDKKLGPRRSTDRVTMNLGESRISGLPIGNGETIRGERSCVGPETLIETNLGLMRIADADKYLGQLQLYTGESQQLEYPSHFIKTAPIDTYQVTTKGGYNFICSEIHKVFTTNGWKLAKDLVDTDFLVFNNQYQFPQENIKVSGMEMNENLGWLFGILLSEGSINTRHNLDVRMTDKNCVDRIKQAFLNIDDKINPCTYTVDKRYDERGWWNKESYEVKVCNLKLREVFVELGLLRKKALQKTIPWAILMSPKNVVAKFLSGLFEGDGTAFLYKDSKRTNNLGIAYYSASETLINQLQTLLFKLDIFSSKTSRKSTLSSNPQYSLRFYGKSSIRLINLITVPKWTETIKQARLDIKFMKEKEALKVKSVSLLPDKQILYDFTMPNSHSFMGNCFRQHNTNLIVDEFNTVPEEIYEMVISPFTAVHANPIQKMMESSRRTLLEHMGNASYGLEDDGNFGNQSILAGTPGYTFQHFYKYFEQYKGIVQSRGNMDLLREVFKGEIPKNFNWKHYSVLRLSHELLPDNYLDADTIARSKATVDIGTFLSEYGAVFISDSNGFFKRSLIEGCTTNRFITLPQSGPVQFTAAITGNKSHKYVYAVDPASEQDNFSIVILELRPDHRRVVYCWTTTRKKHRAQVKKGITQEITFYEYCVRKLRDLMRLFPCERIMVDAMGGAYAVEEAFHAKHILEPGEQFVWRVIDPEDPQEWDSYAGQHLLEMVQFAKADWVNLANHGLKKDMEDKRILFPMFDAVKLAYSIEKDKRAGRENDTLEDCMLEIEELKNELTTIIHTKTASGRDVFNTPEIKLAGNKKGRLKKDRYSALVMANMGARILQEAAPPIPEYNPMGGFAHAIKKPEGSHALYCGVVPPELQKVASADSTYGCIVRRS